MSNATENAAYLAHVATVDRTDPFAVQRAASHIRVGVGQLFDYSRTVTRPSRLEERFRLIKHS